MARGGGKSFGGLDDMIWIVILGGAAYVGYYAITGTAKGRICGSKDPGEVANAKDNIASLIASFLKRNSAPTIVDSLSKIKSVVIKYQYALNDLVQKNLCQYSIDPVKSPPSFWKAFANYTLIIAAQHHVTLKTSAVALLNEMKSTGNGQLITSAYTNTKRAYETIKPNVTPHGFRFADAIYNVYDSRYSFKYRNEHGVEDMAEQIPIAGADNPALVDG